jgi:hypothetical protein
MLRLLLRHHQVYAGLGWFLALCLLWPAASPAQRPPADPHLVVPPQTIALCGESCNCGGARLISRQHAPCEVTSSTGGCSSGSGQCCVCESTQTIAVCSQSTCDCDNSQLLTKMYAPCAATSAAGQCRIGSGQCCVCILE